MTQADVRDDGWGWVQRVRAELASGMPGFEPGVVHARDAVSLMEAFAEIERLAAAGKAAMAARVAETSLWRRGGDRSAAEWMARTTGTSVGQARAELATARKLDELPQVKEAVLAGRLSSAQANEVVDAATADPSAEASLLQVAERESLAGLKDRCQQVKAAACTDEVARYEQVRKQRAFRSWTSREGAFRFEGSMTPDAGARLLARLQPEAERRFDEARRQGRRETREACAVDALEALVVGSADHCVPLGDSGPGAMVHVRVDHQALVRGHTQNGEVCEIPGVGPIPVATARRLATDAILKVLVTDAVDIRAVAHAGRSVPAGLRTLLEERDRTCVVPGCNVDRSLEIHHWRISHADGGPLSADNCARVCAWHHYLATHHGYHLDHHDGQWVWQAPDTAGPDPP
jgi:hypothetical protein